MFGRAKEATFTKEDVIIDATGKPSFKRDLLDRGQYLQSLTQVLQAAKGPFVMTLGSPWGTGKTTFVRMWQAYLAHEGTPSVLFNAWENDYVENPMLTLVAEMADQLGQLQKGKSKPRAGYKKVWNGAKKAMPKLLSLGTRLALGVSIDALSLCQAGEDVLKELSGGMEQLVEFCSGEVLAQQQTTKNIVKEFKIALKEFVAKYGQGKPLIIFVDELDRCKPTYAVELLESVKHIFDVDGLIFVLLLDRTQLSHTVKAAYGRDLDADNYLRRFIDLEYVLPEPSKRNYINYLAKNVYSFEEFSLTPQDENFDYGELFEKYIIKLHLRIIEKVMLKMTLVLNMHHCTPEADDTPMQFIIKARSNNEVKSFYHSNQVVNLKCEILQEIMMIVVLNKVENSVYDTYLVESIDTKNDKLRQFFQENKFDFAVKLNDLKGFIKAEQGSDRKLVSGNNENMSIAVQYYKELFGEYIVDNVARCLTLAEPFITKSDQ
ncbi:MAG: KAP family P-loop NTPase fold protein [Desulfovibrio sp.]|uniref:KAP family P-loop NTPase fold protein n=1 Tax=Desulfovibrio sp. 7SRBS1 TaxID=3378064 RepID=UPI003B41AFB6